MAFNPEKELIEGNPFEDSSDNVEPQSQPMALGEENNLEQTLAPDHSFGAFLEDFRYAYEHESDLHLLKINPEELGQDDADIWFKFRESQNGNFTLTPDMLEAYKKDVFNRDNPSSNNLAGYISNKILILWIQNGMVRENSVGPNNKSHQ